MTDVIGITDLADTSGFDQDQAAIWAEQKGIYGGFLAGDPTRVDHRIAQDASIWDWETVHLAKDKAEFELVRAARPPADATPKALAMRTAEPLITVWGELALLRHLVAVDYEAPGGAVETRTLRCTLLWAKRDGEWWIVHSHEDVIATDLHA